MARRPLPPTETALVNVPTPAFVAKDWHDYFRTLEGAVSSLEAAFAAPETQTDFISGGIKAPQVTATAAQEYYILIRVPYGMTLTSFSAYNAAGTCTISLKISTVAVTGSTINVNAGGVQTVALTANNVAAAGQFIHINISALAASQNLWFALFFTRTV